MASHPDFDAFVATIARLRAPDGCPWDREQTHQSIAHNMIEEAYEAVDAIEVSDARHLREELGDVLLQVVLQAQIAADAGEFTIDDVCRGINEKMVRRHPHVFGDATAETAKDTSEIWARVKMEERKAAQAAAAAHDAAEASGNAADGAAAPVGDASVLAGKPEGLLDGVPTSFPALMQAQKISRKAVAAGFEWPDEEGIWEKVAEEVEEFKNAAPEDAELEFGDVLFSLVNVARWRGIDAENALRATCVKFRRRWAFIEGAAWAQGKDAADLTVEEQEALWQEAKRRERE